MGRAGEGFKVAEVEAGVRPGRLAADVDKQVSARYSTDRLCVPGNDSVLSGMVWATGVLESLGIGRGFCWYVDGSVLSGTVWAMGVFLGFLGTCWYTCGLICGLGFSGCGGGKRGPGLNLISPL